ncbi:concanavalin A-like lectin/glucanase domain-containing protein [Auriculariales sp. MPI-PUGE-AT-0066]|nr:concanavalin A-like lectin/glucanase domain-containing protein [Auriculariales sp. MPI-PUGE-AT-0066]
MRASTLSPLAFVGLVKAATYNLASYGAGQSFLDQFFVLGGHNDTINGPAYDWWNNGDDFLAPTSKAKELNILSIDSTTGNVKLAVDPTPKIEFNQKRWSMRLESKHLYGLGTVFVFDAAHMPFGCSVWPAYWTSSVDWPNGGEIDIMEQVNKRTTNQMVRIPENPCTSGREYHRKVILPNCQKQGENNSGCSTSDPRTTSFGEGFNSGGGGIWVTEFAETAISIWFFPRSEVPEALSAKTNATTIDTSTLGTPVAQLASGSNCDIKSNFDPQKVIINISLCGNFAGKTEVLNQSGCAVPADKTCYNQYVLGYDQPEDFYKEAYFEVVSHRIFTTPSATVTIAEPGGVTEDKPATDTPGGGNNGGTTGGTNGGSSTTNSGSTPSSTPTGAASKTSASFAVAALVLGFSAALL